MSNTAYALNAYTQSKTAVASPVDLVIMLYDGAIDYLDKAATAVNMKETKEKIKYIDKTVAIIDELLKSLNLEAGGEIAVNLQDLYIYMMRELTMANLQNDAEKIKHVESLLRELVSAWRQIR
ncbi:MAG: flagellar export chaperone FliS [Nitrospirae bacterium GWA2_42_11]|nr:MAG: flagellar export chaperone FliS [Nitrospirae bacterium GWA2_42_11]HAS17887.1 flagellar export chaperone FliS [Nitrospiraceae bacterium]